MMVKMFFMFFIDICGPHELYAIILKGVTNA